MEPVRSIQRPEMRISPFVVVQKKEQNIELNDEMAGYFWTSLKGVVQCKGTVKFRSEEFPACAIGSYVIWGLTYKIVHNLLSILSALDGIGSAS